DELLIIDVDPRHGGDDSLAELEAELGPLPHSWEVKTGGGGRHLYFTVPAGSNISNLTNWRPGVDLKSAGGYVMAPPSNHISGERYQWRQPRLSTGRTSLPAKWLCELPK